MLPPNPTDPAPLQRVKLHLGLGGSVSVPAGDSSPHSFSAVQGVFYDPLLTESMNQGASATLPLLFTFFCVGKVVVNSLTGSPPPSPEEDTVEAFGWGSERGARSKKWGTSTSATFATLNATTLNAVTQSLKGLPSGATALAAAEAWAAAATQEFHVTGTPLTVLTQCTMLQRSHGVGSPEMDSPQSGTLPPFLEYTASLSAPPGCTLECLMVGVPSMEAASKTFTVPWTTGGGEVHCDVVCTPGMPMYIGQLCGSSPSYPPSAPLPPTLLASSPQAPPQTLSLSIEWGCPPENGAILKGYSLAYLAVGGGGEGQKEGEKEKEGEEEGDESDAYLLARAQSAGQEDWTVLYSGVLPSFVHWGGGGRGSEGHTRCAPRTCLGMGPGAHLLSCVAHPRSLPPPPSHQQC